jgi:type I restriction enzyme, S subunit
MLVSFARGILGIACVITDGAQICLGQRMLMIRPDPKKCISEFLALMMNAPQTLSTVVELTGGTASPHLNVGDVRKFAVPMPPVAEQKRLVARVERLMKLCDDLEAKLRSADATAARFGAAVVAETVAP